MTAYKSDHEKDVHEADGPPVDQNGNRSQSTFGLTMPGASGARRWRIRVSDALLVVASVLLTLLLFEVAFSLIGLRYVPLRLQQYLSNELRPFAQSSKAGVVPRHAIVLLGDSYAQGAGDWLLEANPNGNGAFHSAH